MYTCIHCSIYINRSIDRSCLDLEFYHEKAQRTNKQTKQNKYKQKEYEETKRIKRKRERVSAFQQLFFIFCYFNENHEECILFFRILIKQKFIFLISVKRLTNIFTIDFFNISKMGIQFSLNNSI